MKKVPRIELVVLVFLHRRSAGRRSQDLTRDVTRFRFRCITFSLLARSSCRASLSLELYREYLETLDTR